MKILHPVFLLVFLFFAIPSQAQRKIQEMDPERAQQQADVKNYEHTPWTDKLIYGGNAFALFGSGFSQFILQPQVGYLVNDNFIAGTGFTYIYSGITYRLSNGKEETLSNHVFGPNLFARHKLFGPLFAYGEYMPLNFTTYNRYGDTKRVWGNSLYLGAGISQSSDGRGGYLILLYDVLWRPYNSIDPASFSTSYNVTPWDLRIGIFF